MTEVAAGSKEAIFVGLLRAKGVTRQKSPGLGDTLAAGVGACREVVFGLSRGCRTSREAEGREDMSRERVRAGRGQDRLCYRSIRGERAMSISAIQDTRAAWTLS